MHILITGSTGLVGAALCEGLALSGHDVLRLVRGPHDGPGAVGWDPLASRPLYDDRLEGLDAAIHLAGESIAGRWTPVRRKRIRDSRVLGTRQLVRTLAALAAPPSALLCASAVGFYGDTGDRVIDETAPRGQGFLADVCGDWESEAARAEGSGMRTVRMRLGMVLDAGGGALAKMLPLFRMGLGGPVGHGSQLMSWITLEDAVRAILHLLGHATVSGAVNLTSPGPVTNRGFTRALGRALKRPAVLPLPGVAVRAMLGEMGTTLLMGSAGARPTVLLKTGFTFRTPGIDEALEAVLRP